MGREWETYSQDWIDGDQGGGSPLTADEKLLAGQLAALGKADFPEAGFVAQAASELADMAKDIDFQGKALSRDHRRLWRGMRSAWQWGAGLAGIALLLAVLVFSVNLIPRNAGAPAPAQPSLVSPASTSQPGLPTATFTPPTYTVQQGDTWASIAGRFGMSAPELMALNGISDMSGLRVGQILLIRPQGQSLPATEVAPDNSLPPTEAPVELMPTLPPGVAFAVVSQDEPREVFVRSGPGVVYFPTAPLEPGTRVPIIGRSAQGDWLQLEFADNPPRTGWVFFNQVEVEGLSGGQTILALPVTSPLLPPEAGRPALSRAACATPVHPPDSPEFGQRPGLLIGGGTLKVGDFTFDLWLHCDSVFGTSGGNLDAQSEIAGLGIYAFWTYHGADQAGDTQEYSGIEPYVALRGGSVNLVDGSGGGMNLGLQFPLEIIPDFSKIDQVPLRFVYVLQTPRGETQGVVLTFTLERQPDGFYARQVSVASWQGGSGQLSDALRRAKIAAPTPPVPVKDPAELYPIWKETVDLLNGWQASLLSGPGWVHLTNRQIDNNGTNQLFGGRTEILSEDWYQLDAQGFVTTMAHQDRGIDGAILQQSYTRDGRTVNLTFGTDHPADPAFRLNLASGYSDGLLRAFKSGIPVDRSQTTLDGKPAIAFSWKEDYVTPLNMEGGRVVAASTRRMILDRESGAPLAWELYETNPDGEERLVWRTIYEVAERVQTLPQEVQDLLEQEFQGYTPPTPEGTPPPEGFDPSRSELTSHTVPADSFEQPNLFFGDVYADGYLLGRVDFGTRPGGNCDRSADGSKLAYSYETLDGSHLASATLRWLDLSEVSQVHEVAPELSVFGRVAWSPVADQVAFSACTGLVDGRYQDCGVYLYDLPTNQVRRLTDAGTSSWDLLWKPDGTQIAFVSTLDDAHNFYILDAASGELLSQGVFDADAWQFPAGAPVNDWGVSFPRGYEGTRCFSNP
jgi:LysM repeat protein